MVLVTPDVGSDPALPAPEFRSAAPGRVGYEVAEVDAFVAQLRSALAEEPPAMAPYEVADQRFRAVRLRRGYAMREVDQYLARAQQLLRDRHGEDAVAGVEGRTPEPRHVSTWWIYLVAMVLVAALVAFALTQV